MTPKSNYTRQALVTSLHDGDTIDLLVALGMGTWRKVKCRLQGINAPELSTDEGKAALAALNEKMPVNTTINLMTHNDEVDKYGRTLGILILLDGTNVNDWMVANHHAVPYMVMPHREGAEEPQ